MSECPSKLPGVQRIARNIIHGPTVDTRSWAKAGARVSAADIEDWEETPWISIRKPAEYQRSG